MKEFLKKDYLKVTVEAITISTLLVFFLMVGFKKIRSFLPPPEITKDKLIGFAQYNGYPINFDTGVFLLIVFLPIVILFILSFKKLTK